MELKTLSSATKSFEANGKKYTVSEKISVERFIQYEKLVPELTFGLSFEQIYSNLRKAFELLNKQKFADSSVVIHNIMNGISSIEDEKRAHPALLMASLVINRQDEDVRVYDEFIALDKINDWQLEGLDMLGFFDLSLSSIQGFKTTLIKYTQEQAELISEEIQK